MAKTSKWKYLSSNLNLKVNIKGELKRIHRGSILKENIYFCLLNIMQCNRFQCK